MTENEYIVIWETPINVNAKRRLPGERFIETETQELKNMVTHKYLLKIKKITKKKKKED